MLLTAIQNQLAALYETPIEHCIGDFLITDGRIAAALNDGQEQHNSERVLLRQSADCLDISVYIDAEILHNLDQSDPYARLGVENLNDFLIALEGVSHFNYIVWNATFERQVSQLELELQAEVDKYVSAVMLLDMQGTQFATPDFHHALFEAVHFDDSVEESREQRYRDANRYAGKYCQRLAQRFPAQHREASYIREIRRFYRLAQQQKIRLIDDHQTV